MQIVIDIDEEDYENICKIGGLFLQKDIVDCFRKGTPLPKGHGRLIDADLLLEQINQDKREEFSKHQVWLLASVHNKRVQTTIEADKGEYI